MTRAHTFRPSWRGRLVLPISLALAGVSLFTGEARAAGAGCFAPGKVGSARAPRASATARLPFKRLDSGLAQEPATIVGLWYVEYTATSTSPGPLPLPDVPFLFAQTYKTWHADGTEWENKIAPPETGYCFGVWKHAAGGSVKLHHVGVIPASDGSIVVIFILDEIDRVSPDGRTYTGTWEFKVHGPADFLGTGPVLQTIAGTVVAARFAVE